MALNFKANKDFQFHYRKVLETTLYTPFQYIPGTVNLNFNPPVFNVKELNDNIIDNIEFVWENFCGSMS
jgi:hypothetical protein